MKEKLQPWEAEVRRVIETHEFEYEPAAWAGMEELLDSAAPAEASGAATSWWAQILKWLLPSLLVTGGLLWYTLQPAAKPPTLEGSLPVGVVPEEELPGLPVKAETAEAISSRTLVPPVETLTPSAPRPLVMPLPEMPAPRLVFPPALPRIAAPGLPGSVEPAGQEQDSITTDFKYKRNRKSLFPDVIKKY